MPFFLGIEAFLAFAGAAFFAANFLFAACTVFIPCLFLGCIQPQVAHTTSSSFVGTQSQSLLACHLCLHQVSFALGTSFLQFSCKHPCNLALNSRIHMICTYYLPAFVLVVFFTFLGSFFPLGVLSSHSLAISGCLEYINLRCCSDLKGINQ